VEFVIQTLEVARQPGLGGAVEDDGLAAALARDRREHAECSADLREEALLRLKRAIWPRATRFAR